MDRTARRGGRGGGNGCAWMAVGAALVVVAGVVVLGGDLTWLKKSIGGAGWSLTYEAKGANGQTAQAREIFWGRNLDRYKEGVSTERVGPVALPWSQETVINVGEKARVEVRPEKGAVASCRILLDGVREVASGTSPAPGEPAVCEVVTSSVPEKWDAK
ncbi:hypothetical protein ACFXDJ_23355 [Streptomyces sp. NPDC059443]|uniref:hypothetical protein n=1 Tax=unclassified Streptomyces TaxID=2593676 RepID=UPI003692D572